MAVPEPPMLVILILAQVRPVGTVSVKVTLAENPFRAVTVIVVVLD